MAPKSLAEAARMLDAARNDRGDAARRLARVDAVGAWLAGRPWGRAVGRLLAECHALRSQIETGRAFKTGGVYLLPPDAMK